MEDISGIKPLASSVCTTRLYNKFPIQVPYELVSVAVPTNFVVVIEMVFVAPIPDGVRAATDVSECQNVASEAV